MKISDLNLKIFADGADKKTEDKNPAEKKTTDKK